jgi:hypothetical protein
VAAVSDDPFVVVALQSGLGNQLFQYASALGIATRVGAQLVFDSSLVRPDEHYLPELLGDSYLEVSTRQLRDLGLANRGMRAVDVWQRVALGRALDISRGWRGMTVRCVPPGGDAADPARFRPELFFVTPPAYLSGYLQSERYFEDIGDRVAESIRLPAPLPPLDVFDGRSVAVSFRRGDYVRLGWALPLGYYARALETVVNTFEDPTLVVFGDDPVFTEMSLAWVSRFGTAVSAYEYTDDALAQLSLLASCDHAILANSSFAWWGAWLGERRAPNRSRLILAPEQYLRWGDDIVPERWQIVPEGEAGSINERRPLYP